MSVRASRNLSNEWMCPGFLGVSHTLESEKKRRKLVDDEHQHVFNRVLHLEKELHRAGRSLDQHRKLLREIDRTRSRRNQDRQEKQLQEYLRQQDMARLRLQSGANRRTGQQNREEARKHMQYKNKSLFLSVKRKLDEELDFKRQQDEADNLYKSNNFKSIEAGKRYGRHRVNMFMHERNRKSLHDYELKISEEKQLKTYLQKDIAKLELKEQILIDRLKHSYEEEHKIKETIKKVYKIDVNRLYDQNRNKPLTKQKLMEQGPESLFFTQQFPQEISRFSNQPSMNQGILKHRRTSFVTTDTHLPSSSNRLPDRIEYRHSKNLQSLQHSPKASAFMSTSLTMKPNDSDRKQESEPKLRMSSHIKRPKAKFHSVVPEQVREDRRSEQGREPSDMLLNRQLAVNPQVYESEPEKEIDEMGEEGQESRKKHKSKRKNKKHKGKKVVVKYVFVEQFRPQHTDAP